jgi:hypothetical protein
MKFNCICGEVIRDQSDYLPNKAYVVPDESYFDLLDFIDDAIEKSGPTAADKEAAAMRVRGKITGITRHMFQCSGCGRIYVDGPPKSSIVYRFDPANEAVPTQLLRKRNDPPA